jgi:hypothetical protein
VEVEQDTGETQAVHFSVYNHSSAHLSGSDCMLVRQIIGPRRCTMCYANTILTRAFFPLLFAVQGRSKASFRSTDRLGFPFGQVSLHFLTTLTVRLTVSTYNI